jgi:maltose O-acetyltransferase
MRVVWYLGYQGFARWLPESTAPLGTAARSIRGFFARRLLRSCGDNINVERCADFGSGRHVQLGSRSGLGVRARLVGPVLIGDDVMMGPDVTILTRNHAFADTSRPMRDQGAGEISPVTISDDVWIGMRVIVLPGVTIGRGAIIGAGAVVTKDVPPYCVAVGNPARVVRNRLEREVLSVAN